MTSDWIEVNGVRPDLPTDTEMFWKSSHGYEAYVSRGKDGCPDRRRQSLRERGMNRTISIARRVQEIITQHGGVRPAARALEIDAAYLIRMRDGDKNDPSPAILKKLKLKKCITYETTVGGW